MTDEEKKAIEIINKVKDEKPFIFWFAGEPYNKLKIFETILNLIEKQSKEIEELKFRKEESIHITKETVDFINSHYIHKDKIKAKIEEIEKRRLQDGECELALHGFQREAKLEVLQSLLNEEE